MDLNRLFVPAQLLAALVVCSATSANEVRFNEHIRPILSENCFHCHGPDPGSRKAGLRLDREEELFLEREGEMAISKGNPEGSLIYQRLITTDPDEVMPPPESHKKLKPEEIELVRRWIEEGAEWEDHWSFIVPKRVDPPNVVESRWSDHPIDRFVRTSLASAGLTPGKPAERQTLARRLSLDVTGLPPSPEMVRGFLSDKSPNAVDRFVNKLFASPHHGEHMARYWLDAARYADTHGLHFDNYREMWPYRDWVISAFNQNMRFDQFTVEQLAGDLLPEPTLQQRVATGFHRCNITTNEGGVIDEEIAVMYARERVETTGTVFLGLTMGCAVCHDHKFDAISMKDFYSMSAYFNNLTQKPRDGNIEDTPPVIMVGSAEEFAEIETLKAEKRKLEDKLSARESELEKEANRWILGARPEVFAHPVDVESLEFHLPLKGGQGRRVWNSAGEGVLPIVLPENTKWGIDADHGPFLNWKDGLAEAGNFGGVDADEPISFGAWVKPGRKNGAVIARMDVPADHRGWDLWVEDNGRKISTHFVHSWPSNAMKIASRSRVLTPGKWHHLFVTYDGSRDASGLKLFVNGKRVISDIQRNNLRNSIKAETSLTIGGRTGAGGLTDFGVEDIRVYRRQLDSAEVESLALAREMRRLAGLPAGEEKRNSQLRKFYFSQNDPLWAKWKSGIASSEEALALTEDKLPVTHVMQEKEDGMAMAHILDRGNYDQPGEEVSPSVLEALHPLPAGASQDRMGLAEWIVSTENPLTARVTVNRLWQQVFGAGLVGTAGDFGIMGDRPSHPELLDWLAVEFVDSGWDLRHIFRLILTSETYAQSALVSTEKLEKDPANRLLSRGPRFRMDAEMVRDYALSASGLLVRDVGGVSVKPYQPDGVWSAVAMPNSNTKLYAADKGEKLYRRSLYTFWKRAAPPASMEIFNAPSREVCTVQRERTNTPLQALVTMNDPQMVEAARALGERAMKSALHTEARVDFMARHLLSRGLKEEEKSIVLGSFREFADYYRRNPEDADSLISTGDSVPNASLNPGQLAAWTMVANQLLNLDEVLNK